MPRPAAKAASTAFFERKKAGTPNFSKASSAIFSRADAVLNDGSAISSGWSAASAPRQLLYECSISASAASQSVTIPSVIGDSTRMPSRRTAIALLPTKYCFFALSVDDASPPITPTADGSTNFGVSSPAYPHFVDDEPISITTAETSSPPYIANLRGARRADSDDAEERPLAPGLGMPSGLASTKLTPVRPAAAPPPGRRRA